MPRRLSREKVRSRGRQLQTLWNLEDSAMDHHPAAWRDVEHVIHELAHATLLDIVPSKTMEQDITDALSTVPEIVAKAHEELTWAVEIEVLKHFGLLGGRPYTLKECFSTAKGVMCDLSRIRSARRDPLLRHVVREVVWYFEKAQG